MVTRVLAVAAFAANWIAWSGVPALEDATSFRVSTAILCSVTVTLGVVALALRSRLRWPWFVVIAGSAGQAVAAAFPTSAVGDWEYIPAILAMACSAFVYLAAVGAFVGTFVRDTK